MAISEANRQAIDCGFQWAETWGSPGNFKVTAGKLQDVANNLKNHDGVVDDAAKIALVQRWFAGYCFSCRPRSPSEQVGLQRLRREIGLPTKKQFLRMQCIMSAFRDGNTVTVSRVEAQARKGGSIGIWDKVALRQGWLDLPQSIITADDRAAYSRLAGVLGL